ncbi:hypothetical protein JNM87_01055 [Candidatus Saccharibacteria bacterium]|nr:hypothetical protein [Candidatus Saccharibacteria bacterium]
MSAQTTGTTPANTPALGTPQHVVLTSTAAERAMSQLAASVDARGRVIQQTIDEVLPARRGAALTAARAVVAMVNSDEEQLRQEAARLGLSLFAPVDDDETDDEPTPPQGTTVSAPAATASVSSAPQVDEFPPTAIQPAVKNNDKWFSLGGWIVGLLIGLAVASGLNGLLGQLVPVAWGPWHTVVVGAFQLTIILLGGALGNYAVKKFVTV